MNALGMIELNSIPVGVLAGDAMLKAAMVQLVFAQSVCAGKYIVIVTGDVAAVTESVAAGKSAAGHRLVDGMVISHVHEQVPRAINACNEVGQVAAAGVMEAFSLCAAVVAADAAAKAADIRLMDIRLGRGLGGKAFITLTGDVSAVRAAVSAAEKEPQVQGLMAESVVIAHPHPDMIQALY
ncbi:MAG: BMC domain-containing protein [Oscillospiraceae bacterium]|jgi:microcompartment protein CcmL/EutN|nr:BMC domain-containing protein [Oscillospiraceae bacterium]